MDDLKQRNQGQKKKKIVHLVSTFPKCQNQKTHKQQLQENPFPFNHNRFGHTAKPQFSNSSKTIKLYTQQENPKKKKGRIQRDKPKHYEAFQQTSSMLTQKTSFKNANNNSYC